MAQYHISRGGIWIPVTDELHRADANPHPGVVVLEGDSRLADARDPNAHATTHEDGDSDPVDITALAGYSGNAGDVLRGDKTWAANSAFSASYYYGYHDTGSMTWSSTTWTGIHNVLTFVDVDQVGITRSNSDFTIDDAGDYIVDVKAGVFKSGVPAHCGFRVLVNGTMVGMHAPAVNNSSQLGSAMLHKRISCAASDVVTLEYCVTAAFGAFGSATLDTIAARIANVEIYRFR